MSDSGDYVRRTRVTDAPDGGRVTYRETTEVRRGGAAGWWVAALIAVMAVVGLALVLGSMDRQDDLQAARAQGAAQASVDAATTDAQRAATQASQAAQSAMDSTARATQRAAEAAQTQANQTSRAVQSGAASASESGRDASDTAPAPQP
jgi:hypothetical protein